MRFFRSAAPVVPTVVAILLYLPLSHAQQDPPTLRSQQIAVAIDKRDGSFVITDPHSGKVILHALQAARIDQRWINSADYPVHSVESPSANELTIVNGGLRGEPDLIVTLRLHNSTDYVTVAAKVRNGTDRPVTVQAIRGVEIQKDGIDLGGSASADRVLSDSFSEDRPGMEIHELAQVEGGMHKAVGSQLIYNTQTRRDLFVGTLSSEKFLTVLRLHTANSQIGRYEVESTGTTELAKENSLQGAPAEDQIDLSLPLGPGSELSAESLFISTGSDYLAQLQAYGSLIRELHHPREIKQSPAGWWSWTAYYFGLNENTAVTNAQWLAENLKDFGYTFFHIDEGYQFARGEYTTPDAALFPGGMRRLERKAADMGLTPGIWTAPFEVSERSWVFENHKDWLVHNAAGNPIHAGWVIRSDKGPSLGKLYILDSTNPGAQGYLKETYSTLAKQWGIRYIKLDFMDDSAIEGFYHLPNTTALEAQRIGLKVIRDAVGEEVLLDKDGSPMLNPVGLVDTGRTSLDTGHKFAASKEAATGVAARFYMNRNFYLADPDAFTVSRQTVADEDWHGGVQPLTLNEAKVSIALAAVAGGMYEIGDDLPTLGRDADRLALVKNKDLMTMARLGHASLPLDLMSYAKTDEIPSLFLLNEDRRQSVLTVFNWTEKETRHNISLRRDLNLGASGYEIRDAFDGSAEKSNDGNIVVTLPPHSVRILKIMDKTIPPSAPEIVVRMAKQGNTGEPLEYSAKPSEQGTPATGFHWDFGDGTTSNEQSGQHAYTYAGNFVIKLTVEGLDGIAYQWSQQISTTGDIGTQFDPAKKKRRIE